MANLLFPLPFTRQFEGPIDTEMVFETTAALNDYATSPRRYAGQIATCKEQPGALFVMASDKSAWLEISGTAGDNVTWNQEVFALDSDDITNEFVDLEHAPLHEDLVSLFVINGGPQEVGVDYYIELSPSRLRWGLHSLASVLEIGDKLKVIYPYKA